MLPPQEAGGEAAFLASGFGGQFIAVLPAKRLVVSQTVAKQDNPRGVVACNPPYDARLQADPALYRALGRALVARVPTWTAPRQTAR